MSTLLVMAAGLGSRYGGLKQLDRVGPDGETLIDYAVFDAGRAGFARVVFIIREEIADAFTSSVRRFRKALDVSFVYQDPSRLPAGFQPRPRSVPWGTVHAVLAARGAVESPFATINADDFYGADAYRIALARCEVARVDATGSAVLLPLERTLSEHGPVVRAVCRVGGDGWIDDVEEVPGIRRTGGTILAATDGDVRTLDGQVRVSMNLWVFPPVMFELLDGWFGGFLRRSGDDPRAEAGLPQAIGDLIARRAIRVRAVDSPGPWFGLTHAADRPRVAAALREFHERGDYPSPLWKF
jgi:hypothetical protein